MSPAQLLIEKQIHSTVPMSAKLLDPKWLVFQNLHDSDEQFKQAQKRNFDKRHGEIDLSEFKNDDPVFVVTRAGTNPLPGTIVHSTTDWSYEVQTPSGVVRRNKYHLHFRPEESPTAPMTVNRSEPRVVLARSPVATRTSNTSSRQIESPEKWGCSVTD